MGRLFSDVGEMNRWLRCQPVSSCSQARSEARNKEPSLPYWLMVSAAAKGG